MFLIPFLLFIDKNILVGQQNLYGGESRKPQKGFGAIKEMSWQLITAICGKDFVIETTGLFFFSDKVGVFQYT